MYIITSYIITYILLRIYYYIYIITYYIIYIYMYCIYCILLCIYIVYIQCIYNVCVYIYTHITSRTYISLTPLQPSNTLAEAGPFCGDEQTS